MSSAHREPAQEGFSEFGVFQEGIELWYFRFVFGTGLARAEEGSLTWEIRVKGKLLDFHIRFAQISETWKKTSQFLQNNWIRTSQ